MAVTIQQARQQVERCTKRLVSLATHTAGTATEVEKETWAGCLEFGRAIMGLFLARRALGSRHRRYEHDGGQYEVVGHETLEIGTQFGKIEILQPVGRRIEDGNGKRDLPLMRELGLPGGFTLPVVTLFGRLCAMMSFAQARGLFRCLWGWSPSPRAVLRMVDATGQQARPYLDQAVVPEQDGEVLVIEVDGKGAPAISSREYARRTQPRAPKASLRRHARRLGKRKNPRPRRAPGKKSKNAKMAAIGVLYTLQRSGKGKLEGPLNKRVYATFEGYRPLFEWLRAQADRRGYGTKKFSQVLFIADGARAIWSLKQQFFPDCVECLDWYHAVEKLWAAGKALCHGTRKKRTELEEWVADKKKALRNGKARKVIAELKTRLDQTPATGPGNKFRREVLTKVLEHFTAHAARMGYDKLRAEDLPIGSGVVEGATRHLVGVRLDGPGMRWSRDRAEAVLRLRCVLINGDWSPFEAFLATRRTLRLASQPVPTRTHDARAALAA